MIYSKTDKYTLYNGKMQDELKNILDSSIDAIITDPPYELGFMGKTWDSSGVAFQKETWQHCYRVLKPGGYLLAFGGSRTFYRIACAIEDAGFEIRDTIMWLYGSGFPKSMNIGFALDKANGVDNRTGQIKTDGAYNGKHFDGTVKTLNRVYEERKAQNEWDGWGTCLKPSYEPIIVARKPFSGSLIDNVLEYGVGGLNIDECRVPIIGETVLSHNAPKGTFAGGEYDRGSDTTEYREQIGRFTANTILTYDDTDYDEVCGGFPNTIDDSGSASRYFYCAKASKKDRDEGLDEFEEKSTGELQGGRKEGSAGSIMINADGSTRVNPYAGTGTPKKNTHPTVKPTELMQYLIRLVTPRGGTVLDCFMGSGSNGWHNNAKAYMLTIGTFVKETKKMYMFDTFRVRKANIYKIIRANILEI